MARLSASEIGAEAVRAGVATDTKTGVQCGFEASRKCTRSDFINLETAIAVALAESGGNTRAHNTRPPDNSYGLWQINMFGPLGPARRRRFGIDDNDELFRPEVNARAMAIISSRGRFWRAWTTYTGGSYRSRLPEARKAARGLLSGDPGQVLPESQAPGAIGVGDIFGWASGIVAFAKFITDPKTWLRAGEAIAGAGLIGMGTYFIIRDVGTGGR
jgi:hypothetical protein